MKIVQTFWSGGQNPKNVIKNSGGWLSAEYHWFAWNLSVLQLRKFYDEVELVTDAAGKHILIDVLQLPYTSVRVVLDVINHYPPELWALAKIYVYSLQNQPFLHIDGDIFIWKPFEERLLNAPLIAQNFEIDFPFYKTPLHIIQSEFAEIPDCITSALEKQPEIYSSNTGVIGGHQLDIFKKHKQYAFELIDKNRDQLDRIEAGKLNICVEQFLFHSIAQETNIAIEYVIDNQGEFDPTYPNYANFFSVPYKTWFIHAMANYKRQDPIISHLGKRLRRDYPEKYYHVLNICVKNNIELYHQGYKIETLSPEKNKWEDYKNYEANYLNDKLQKQDNEWLYFYAKDCHLYRQSELIFGMSNDEILKQTFVFDTDCNIEESYNPDLEQKLLFAEVETLSYKKWDLEPLDMVLLDALQEPQMAINLIEIASFYYNPQDVNENKSIFENIVISRLQDFWYIGAIKILKS